MEMIQEENLIEVGKILKPHGVKGDMIFLFNHEQFAEAECNHYFFLLDGLFVPFFVEEFRFISSKSAAVNIEGINTIEEAINYNDVLLYLPKEVIDQLDDEAYFESEWEQFIGYTVLGENDKLIGLIEHVDASTMNVLFIVKNDNQEILIPATANFILEINSAEKQLRLDLPDGLLDGSLD